MENTTPIIVVTVTDEEYKVMVFDRDGKHLADHPATYMVQETPDKNEIAFTIDLSGEEFQPTNGDEPSVA